MGGDKATVADLAGRVSAGGAGGQREALFGGRGTVADFCYVCLCVAVDTHDCCWTLLWAAVHAHVALCIALWRRGRPAMGVGRQCARCCVSDLLKRVRACTC